MTRKTSLKITLVSSLTLLSFSGFCIHMMIHPPSEDAVNYMPFIIGILGSFIVPLMFFRKDLIAYAYVLNGFFAVIGMVVMGHYALAHNPEWTLSGILFGSVFADILLAFVKLLLGKAVFDLELLKNADDPKPKGRFFRFPNMGWWWLHLAAISAVYALGNIFWK